MSNLHLLILTSLWTLYCLFAFYCMSKNFSQKLNTPLSIAIILIIYPLTLLFEFEFRYPIQMLISFMVIFCLIYVLIKVPLWIHLFYTSMYVLIFVFTQCVISSLNAITNGLSFYAIYYTNVGDNSLFFLSSPFISFLFYGFINQLLVKFNIFKMSHYKRLREILTTVLLVYGILMIASTAIYQVDNNDIFIPIYHLVLSLLLFASYIWIFLYQYNTISSLEKARSNRRLLHLVNTQKSHYQKSTDYIRSLRKVKHDYHWLLYELTENQDALSHHDLITRLQEQYQAIDDNYHQYANNLLVDSIISEVSQTCQQHDIDFRCTLHVPNDLTINEDEFCFLITTYVNMCIDKIMTTKEVKKHLYIHDTNNENWYLLNFTFTANDVTPSEDLITRPDFMLAKELIEAHGGYIQADHNQQTQTLNANLVLPKTLKNPTSS